MRAADCDTPGCQARMEGRDDDELLRAIRRHVDEVHPDDAFTDQQLKEWMAQNAYTVDPARSGSPS